MNSTNLSDRILFLLDYFGETKTEMARKVGIKMPSLHSMITGASQGMKATTALNFVYAYGVNIEWLVMGKGEPFTSEEIRRSPREQAELPLIAWGDLRSFLRDHTMIKKSAQRVLSPVNLSDRAFTIPVEDGAMDPRFSEGDLVYADPEIEAKPGNFVIAFVSDTPFLRRLVQTGAKKYLVALNTSWPGTEPISVDETVEVVATVVGKFTKS